LKGQNSTLQTVKRRRSIYDHVVVPGLQTKYANSWLQKQQRSKQTKAQPCVLLFHKVNHKIN